MTEALGVVSGIVGIIGSMIGITKVIVEFGLDRMNRPSILLSELSPTTETKLSITSCENELGGFLYKFRK